MQLIRSTERLRYEVLTKDWTEKDVPKAAGFRWDGSVVRWHTNDHGKALAVAAARGCTVDPALLARIRADLEAAREAHKATVAASRATDADVEIPVPAGKALLPFQKAGAAYCLARDSVIVADQPGLGKTVQALAVCNAMMAEEGKERLRILIVCPKIAINVWRRHAAEWLIHPHSIALWDSKRQPEADIVVVNYDILAKDDVAKALRAVRWDVRIADEAQALKDGKALRTMALLGGRKTVTRNKVETEISFAPVTARKTIFLSGTPIMNRPIEILPMLKAMGVPAAQNWRSFVTRYCGGRQTSHGWDVSGATNLDELQDLLRGGYMVRRLKADVLTELPPKRYSVIELEADTPALRACVRAENEAEALQKAHRKSLGAKKAAARKAGDLAMVNRLVAEMRTAEMSDISEIARLRCNTAIAKAPAAIEHLVGLLEDSDQSVLCFGHHKEVIAQLAAGLRDKGYEPAIITGDTSARDRQIAEDDIQAGRKRVFLGSIMACGTAITLHKASIVVFAEQAWTGAAMEQAEDRAHRNGQRNAVLVQHLVVEGSIDVNMCRLIADKGYTVAAALDDEHEVIEVTIEVPAENLVSEADVAAQAAAAQAQAAADAQAAAPAEQPAPVLSAPAPIEQPAHLDEAPDAPEMDPAQASVAAQAAGSPTRGLAEAMRRFMDGGREERAPEPATPRPDIAGLLGADAEASPELMEILPEAQRAAIHAALKMLAGWDQDEASVRNGAGFSKSDTRLGHYLADLGALGDREALEGRDLVVTYRNQLPDHLLSDALGQVIAPTPGRAAKAAAPTSEIKADRVTEKTAASKPEKPAPTYVPTLDEVAAVRDALASVYLRGGFRKEDVGLADKYTKLTKMNAWEYVTGRKFVSLYAEKIPADLLAAVFGEAVPAVAVAPTQVAAAPAPTVPPGVIVAALAVVEQPGPLADDKAVWRAEQEAKLAAAGLMATHPQAEADRLLAEEAERLKPLLYAHPKGQVRGMRYLDDNPQNRGHWEHIIERAYDWKIPADGSLHPYGEAYCRATLARLAALPSVRSPGDVAALLDTQRSKGKVGVVPSFRWHGIHELALQHADELVEMARAEAVASEPAPVAEPVVAEAPVLEAVAPVPEVAQPVPAELPAAEADQAAPAPLPPPAVTVAAPVPSEPPTVTELPPPAPSEPPRRGKGRPQKGAVAMTGAERQRAFKLKSQALYLPVEIMQRIKKLRKARGETANQVLAAAMDALERALRQSPGRDLGPAAPAG